MRRIAFFLFGLLWWEVAISHAVYDDLRPNLRRIQTSLEWFPKIISIDKNLKQKETPQGNLNLIFIYQNDRNYVEQLAGNFQQRFPRISNAGVQTLVVNIRALPSMNNISAVFVAEHLVPADIQLLNHYAQIKNILVFSPFVGDVEQGVTAGISTQGRIQPYFNSHALKSTHLQLNENVLKTAKIYE